MEALRHISERDVYRYTAQRSFPDLKQHHINVTRAQACNDTGAIQVETTSCRANTLMGELLKAAQPHHGSNASASIAEWTPATGPSLELIHLPTLRETRERISLDQQSLLDVYTYLDLDPWLLGQFCRRSASWTCCVREKGILNFQLLTSMYYIAWSVNTTSATGPKTKAILMPQEHIGYSRCFAAEAMLEELVRSSVIGLQQPFGLANFVLLDVISYMQTLLDEQWTAEVKKENLTGHGVFGYGDNKKIANFDTRHLAFAAREIGLSVGMVSWCVRLAKLAERIVSDLKGEVEEFRASAENGQAQAEVCQAHQWAQDLSSVTNSLNSAKKIIWNFQREVEDLDNRVRSQFDTVRSPRLVVPIALNLPGSEERLTCLRIGLCFDLE